MDTIVVLNIPAHGHVNPTLPVVRELIRRGEQVIYYDTAEFRTQIEATGATFRAYPAGAISSKDISTALHDGVLVRVSELLLASTEKLLPFVLEEFGRTRPDLIMFDSTALWGRMAATEVALPAVGSITTFVFDERMAGIRARDLLALLGQTLPRVPWLLRRRARLKRRYPRAYPKGQPLFPVRGELNLVFTSRALQPDSTLIDESFTFVGPSIDKATRGTRDLGLPVGRPLIYLSLGTIHVPSSELLRECFEALADIPAHALVSIAERADIRTLDSTPDNVTIRRSVPQLQVLQHCDVFITHGGINSLHEALYYGVPLVLIPLQFEQLLNARVAEDHGAGLVLDGPMRGRPLTASALRDAVQRVLTEPGFRTSARSAQDILRATGGYTAAADAIQAFSR